MTVDMKNLLIALCLLVLVGGTGCDIAESPSGSADAGTIGGGGDDAGADGSAPPDAGPAVTWYRDVLPLVQDNCQSCHDTGGIGPFEMKTYGDVAGLHELIAASVAERTMPPWMPDDSCIPLQDSKRLTAEEITTFEVWSALGAPAGDPKDAPAPRMANAGLEWVDATLDPGVDYTPNQAIPDDYRCFILPPSFAKTTDIIGFEIVPGAAHQVHHAIIFDVPGVDAQALDDAEAGPGWTCYGGPGVAQDQVRMIGGWVPGNGATPLPQDTGVRVLPGHVIVLQLHYNTTHGVDPDRTQVKLQYAKTPVAKPATIFPVTASTFSIPPNSMNYSAKGTFTLPDFVTQATVYGTTPHMHQLGRSISAKLLTTPEKCMVNIPAWDFHWQQSYKYETPVVVKKGQSIEVSCAWDNPTATPVTWGEATTDEMCVVFFYTTMP